MEKQKIQAFQQKILTWYTKNKRDLPWRETHDPYKILVSEVMLQQTQVTRVIEKYNSWIIRFPTVEDLSKASIADVLTYWSGLGYNRRALNLQKTAKIINSEFNGVFPEDMKKLLSLPGIGTYTASAVLCFAFQKQIPVIDTNIRKVISVEFFSGILPNEKVIEQIAIEILPTKKAYDWNQALMDYSSAVLKTKKIPIPKQSHFLSSDRFLRGQIIKVLLQEQEISVSFLQKHFMSKGRRVEEEYILTILKSLEKEGFLFLQKDKVKMTA